MRNEKDVRPGNDRGAFFRALNSEAVPIGVNATWTGLFPPGFADFS